MREKKKPKCAATLFAANCVGCCKQRHGGKTESGPRLKEKDFLPNGSLDTAFESQNAVQHPNSEDEGGSCGEGATQVRSAMVRGDAQFTRDDGQSQFRLAWTESP